MRTNLAMFTHRSPIRSMCELMCSTPATRRRSLATGAWRARVRRISCSTSTYDRSIWSSRTMTSSARVVSKVARASRVRSSWVCTSWPIWSSLASSPSRRCSKVVRTRQPPVRRGHRTRGPNATRSGRWTAGERAMKVSGRSLPGRRLRWNVGPMPKVMVVDDEESLLEAIRYALSREGFEGVTARDGGDAVRDFDAERPDLVVLDLMLPTLNGWDVCRRIRATSQVPILMLTARDAEVDRVVGLEMGADDYVTKPFSLRELVARVRALLRRAGTSVDGPRPETAVLEAGGIRLDAERHEVSVRGTQVNLPLKEFELLEILMENRNRVLTRQTLIDRVWGYDYVGDTKTLDVHVKRLRARVEEDRHDPRLIVTVRGVGYRFDG